MELTKVVVFIGAFLLLLLAGRKLSAMGESSIADTAPPDPPDDPADSVSPTRRTPALTGADLPFPVELPPVQRQPNGGYNRPRILNYYFGKIDLVQGPPDPRAFCDDFFITIQNPEDDHSWTVQYVAATPAGLQRELEADSSSALYLEARVVIVARWDVPLILQTVTEEIMKHWVEPDESLIQTTPIKDIG